MDSEGVYEFETVEAAREAYETAGPVAQIIVKETAKAMAFDNAEYDEAGHRRGNRDRPRCAVRLAFDNLRGLAD